MELESLPLSAGSLVCLSPYGEKNPIETEWFSRHGFGLVIDCEWQQPTVHWIKSGYVMKFHRDALKMVSDA